MPIDVAIDAGHTPLGRNNAGEHLLVAGRVVEYGGVPVFRVFHIGRMTDAERKRFQRQVRR